MSDYGIPINIEDWGCGQMAIGYGAVRTAAQAEAQPGPDGWLRVRRDREGKYRIDEDDDDVCHPAAHGRAIDESGGQIVIDVGKAQ